MNSKHLVLLIVFVVVALMVTSCGKRPEVGEPTEELPVLVEEELIEEMPETLMVEEELIPEQIEVPIVPVETYGYRVQIGAFMSQSNAELFAAAARTRFTENVYVEPVPPWHKVRVGDLLSREEAEMLKGKALQLGYSGSFIAETMVTPGP